MPAINEPWAHWSSKDIKPAERFDSWFSALNEFHLAWRLNKPEKPLFSGEMRMKRMGEVQFIHCMCDPCSGFRGAAEISRDTEEYYGLLLVQEGVEYIRHLDRNVTAFAGDAYLWDTTRPLMFSLPGELKKTTLFIPKNHLQRQLFRADELVGTVLPAREGLGALVNANLVTLGEQLYKMEEDEYVVAANLAMELLTYWLGKKKPLPITVPRRELLDRIVSYIDQHLSEPELTPKKIANGCNISLRYLHRLFSTTNTSVSHWITQRRLERCRQELAVTGETTKTITDIAFRWGFSDASHFNRLFKRAFHTTPGQYRKGAMSV